METRFFLNIVQSIDPNNYDAHSLSGVLFFLDKNLSKAKKEIKKSRNNLDTTWRYNEAFLAAYKENLPKTEKLYKKAFRSEINPISLFQIENFIYDVLESEKDKCQLWYCAGMINWKAKGDEVLAKEAFEKFLNCDKVDNFPAQKEKVQEYLKQL